MRGESFVCRDRLEPHWQRYDKQRGTGSKGVNVGKLVDELHVWIPPEQYETDRP